MAARVDALCGAALCPRCEQAARPLISDTVELLARFILLRDALRQMRLESANRLAAIRAALGAAADGEPDPLAYLRDQLAEEPGEYPAPGGGRP